jgi:hypothetical protein
MGGIIEEHTQQLEGIERKENLLVDRENELKREKEFISVEREKLRLASVVKIQVEERKSPLKEKVSISKDNEKEIEALVIQVRDAKKEIG